MKNTRMFVGTAVCGAMLFFASCEKNENNETKISSYNETESHNMGQNCMSCHKQGGSGEGWFTLAATVYDSLQTSPYPNSTIKLYTGPNGTGTLKHTIEVDGNGNFYTTQEVNFDAGLYPVVSSNNGTNYMSSPIYSGNCVSCHGNSTSKIWAK